MSVTLRSRMATVRAGHVRNASMTQAFLIEEFKALRTEIEGRAREVHQTVVFAATANAAIASWALASADKICSGREEFRLALGLIPLLVSIPLFLRWCAAHRAINRIGSYIQRVEESIRLPTGLGWETSLRPNRAGRRRRNLAALDTAWMEGLFWAVLALLALGFGYVFGSWGLLFPSLFQAPCWK